MIGVAFFRIFRAAMRNFFRNIWLSIATTVIMVITLLIVLFLFFANVVGLEIIKAIEQKVDLSITFQQGVAEDVVTNVVEIIRARQDVKAVQFVSSDEALRIFREKNQDRPFIEESLQELAENPLPSSMFIVANDPSQYETIAAHLASDRYKEVVEKINYENSRNNIDKLISVITTIKNAGIIVTLIFAILVVLIMFNTVRLAIYSFREEIDIMHLVGASRWFIRGPFIIEAVLVGLMSVIIASFIIYPTLRTVGPELEQFFFTGYAINEPFDVFSYAVEMWPKVIGLQLAVAIGLAIISSFIAIQRYLKT